MSNDITRKQLRKIVKGDVLKMPKIKNITIKNAKYRVKNNLGEYEVIHLETGADQVVESTEKRFVSDAEKALYADKYTQSEIDKKVSDINAKVVELQTKDSEIEGVVSANKTATDKAIEDLGKEVAANKQKVEDYKSSNDAAVQALQDGKADKAHEHTIAHVTGLQAALDAKETIVGAEGKISAALTEAKEHTNTEIGKVNTKIGEVETSVTNLTSRVGVNETDIANLKDAIGNKNSNTIVVNTVDDIKKNNANPKVGDIAFVLDIKKSFIFKGVAEAEPSQVEMHGLPEAPAGWIYFDEISSELDLVDYLKKNEAEGIYRKLDVKIAENDLAAELATKINNKADTTTVNNALDLKAEKSELNAAKDELSGKIDGVTEKLTATKTALEDAIKLKADTTALTTAVDNINTELNKKATKEELNGAKSDLEGKISAVDTKVQKVASDLSAEVTERKDEIKRVEGLVTTLEEKIDEKNEDIVEDINKLNTAIAAEVQDRKNEIAKVEGLISAHAATTVEELAKKANADAVYTKDQVFTKAEVESKISSEAVSVSSDEPEDKIPGHVWLEIV